MTATTLSLVDSQQAAYVVRGWLREGWGLIDIARASGVSSSAVGRLSRDPQERIEERVHHAICNLDEEDIDRTARFVPAGEARRLLEHLQWKGHAQQDIAHAIGTTKAWVSSTLLGEQPRVRRDLRDAVRDYFAAHRDEDGGSVRSHRLAVRRGWKPIEQEETAA